MMESEESIELLIQPRMNTTSAEGPITSKTWVKTLFKNEDSNPKTFKYGRRCCEVTEANKVKT